MSGRTREVARTLFDFVDKRRHVRNVRDYFFRDAWLRRVSNIVHVGANAGQESSKYAGYQLGVLWIEPVPSVYTQLQKNIRSYPNQAACQALVTDERKLVPFNIASNDGQSSSIFELGEHKEIWPDVGYSGRIDLVSQTLDNILFNESRHYDGLVIDTQGSELLVLKGAKKSLPRFKYILAEAADFEMYKGAATVRDLVDFLEPRGFRVQRRDIFARKPSGGGQVFELLFKRH